jgi:hypothetical protein
MSSSVNTADRHWPRLELPHWLPRSVADEARFLYDSAITPNQTVERHVDEPEQTVALKSTGEASGGPGCRTILNSRMQDVCRAIAESNERTAEMLRSMTFEQIELLCRLTSDERMQNVWRELYRQTRGGKQFLNPAKRVFGGTFLGLHHQHNQDMAAGEFFRNAFGHAAWPAPLMTHDDFASKRKSHIGIAARLREDARKLSLLGSDELASDLEAFAARCEEYASVIRPVHLPTVTRSRGDKVLRAYILRMTIVCQMLFGKDLHGTVATTAGVVFSRKIGASQVRDMVRAYNSQRFSR